MIAVMAAFSNMTTNSSNIMSSNLTMNSSNTLSSNLTNVMSCLTLKCQSESTECVQSVYQYSDTHIQIVRRMNGTKNVIAEVATEFVVGTFLLLVLVCVLCFAVYVSISFYVRWRQKGTFLSALQSMRQDFRHEQMSA